MKISYKFLGIENIYIIVAIILIVLLIVAVVTLGVLYSNIILSYDNCMSDKLKYENSLLNCSDSLKKYKQNNLPVPYIQGTPVTYNTQGTLVAYNTQGTPVAYNTQGAKEATAVNIAPTQCLYGSNINGTCCNYLGVTTSNNGILNSISNGFFCYSTFGGPQCPYGKSTYGLCNSF